MSDVLIGKLANMDRAVRRVREVWNRPSDLPFEKDLDKQDRVLLHLQHAIQDMSDCCKHIVRAQKLGWAEDTPSLFSLLQDAGLIDAETEEFLRNANGLRNIMVYRHDTVDLRVVRRAVENELDTLLSASQDLVRRHENSDSPSPTATVKHGKSHEPKPQQKDPPCPQPGE